MRENEIILFEDYLKGLLSNEERTNFETRLKDEVFQQRFKEYQLVRKAISKETNMKEEQNIKSTLDKLGRKYFGEEQSQAKIVPFRSRFFTVRVAASFIVLLGLSFSFLYLNKSKYSDTNLADKYFNKHGSYIVRSGENAQKSRKSAILFSDANKLYERGKYNEAKNLYSAILYEDGPYTDYAEWNLMMIELKNDTKGDHEKTIKRILKNPKHKMYDKALLFEKDLNTFYRKLPG